MSGQENLSVVLHKPGDLRIEITSKPTDPEPDEIQLTTVFCGICGTDIHLWHEGEIGGYVLTAPLTIGHEASATVVKVGTNVKHLKVGDNVVIEPAIPCNNCQQCREGNYNWCAVCNKQVKGSPQFNGLLSRLYNHPAAFAYKIPDDLPMDVAALAEPMAVIVHAAKRVGVTVGHNVLVTGAGTMGLLAFKGAKAYGAAKVIIADINEARLKLAEKMGVDHTYLIKKGDDPVATGQAIKNLLGEAIDITFDCTGAEACMRSAIEATRNGGKVALVGLGSPLIRVPLAQCSLKEIDLIGVCRFRSCFPLAIKLLSMLDLKPIITHKYTLENAMEAFKTMERGEGVKVMVDCRPTV